MDIETQLPSIIADILAGLDSAENERRDSARANHEYYVGDFSRYNPCDMLGSDNHAKPRSPRTSLIMQRVVDLLSQHLYAKGPARALHDAPAASQWLAERYARQGADATFQEADRLALVGDVSAIQVVETEDPAEPIAFQLWPAHQFAVWEDPDDPLVPIAVAVIDTFDASRRLRLWTRDELLTFLTDKAEGTSGGTAYTLDSREDHDFGMAPFAFVHARRPSTQFWSGGPGDNVRELNDYVNIALTEIGDDFHYLGKPVTLLLGVGDGWTPPRPIRAGDFWQPPSLGVDAAGNGIPPSIGTYSPDLAVIEVGWQDLQSYLDHVMMCLGIPPAAVRMVETSAMSGVAIVAEQLPVIMWATSRQRAFADYEKALARAALAVGRAAVDRADLDPKLAAGLTLTWPSMVPDFPLFGQAQDDADARSIAMGLLSRTMITMRRMNCDRETALKHLIQVAQDVLEEAKIGLPPVALGDVKDPEEGDTE